MARSLTVKHDEAPATSPLFTGFLAIAVIWLGLSTLTAGAAEGVAAPPVPDAPVFSQE